MPIKDPTIYPPNWKQISNHIRFDRARGRCEMCNAPHNQIIYRNPDKLENYVTMESDGELYLPNGSPLNGYGHEYTKAVRVVLTVAHLDHDTRNNHESNLMALCQLCHLRYDSQYHAQNAKATRAQKRTPKNQLQLFDEE